MVVFMGIFIIEQHRAAKEKLNKRLGLSSTEPDIEDLGRSSLASSTLNYLRRKFGKSLPGMAVDDYSQKLMWAGKPYGLQGEDFYLIKIIAGILPVIILPAVLLLGSGSGTVLMLIILGGIMYFVPDLILSMKIQERQREIIKDLPSFVDILAICADAGLNLSKAIERTVEVQPGILGEEFRRFNRDLKSGLNRQEALTDLADRNNVEDLGNLVMAISQAEKFGSPIADTLREQAKYMRIHRRNRAQESAQKASTKILFPMIAFTFAPLLVILLGPAVISLGRSLNL